MKTRLLPAMLSLLLFCHLVAAQDYRIRADANINLRDTYSLDGEVVEVVPAGTVLQVVGRFNRWLKIDRDGTLAWMADWVSHTRLTGSEQTQIRTGTGDSGQTQSEIDNCCFVDRQCTVDAEWVSGYQAFQNNQCPVPEQTRQQTTLQTTGIDESGVDNCCYIGWQCQSNEEWESGYFAWRIDHCDVPQGFTIEGPENFVARVKEVLRFLESRSPAWYAYAINGLDRVKLIEEAGVSHVRVRTRTWQVAPDRFFTRTGRRGIISLASSLIHEACHVYRHEAGLQSGGYEGEKDCLQKMIEGTETFDDSGGHVSWLRHLLANIDDPEFQWWQEHFTQIPSR